MTPPVTMLKDTEALDACEAAGGSLRVSAPGYGDFVLVSSNAASPPEPSLSAADAASLRQGLADFQNSDYIEASELVAKMRAKYGLHR